MARGGACTLGQSGGTREVLVPAEMSYWGQHEGVCRSWFCRGRDAPLVVSMATLWGWGGSGGFGARLQLFYPILPGLRWSGSGREPEGSIVGRAGSVPCPGKGGRGLRGRSWPPLGPGRGPFGVGGCSEGMRGMPVACPPVAGAVTVAPGNFQYCKKFYFFVYCIAVSTGLNFLQNKRL